MRGPRSGTARNSTVPGATAFIRRSIARPVSSIRTTICSPLSSTTWQNFWCGSLR